MQFKELIFKEIMFSEKKNNFLISDIFKLKNRSFRTFFISKEYFPVTMKKLPLQVKLNWHKREDKNCK